MKKYEFLDRVNSPSDVKKLNRKELTALCQDIREFIVENVSKTGGHLSSNLGVVELTVALHKCFNSPVDKFIFDVGHQCYTHKILTGRKQLFYTLRQFDGLSGFQNPKESEHDHFALGHSSTSISMGLGLLRGNKLCGNDGYVISIIGDGSMTGGLAFEGLNNVTDKDTKNIIVLNDNEMSISKNVGALARYLTKIRNRPTYFKFKNSVKHVVSSIPLVGKHIVSRVSVTKSVLKDYIYKKSTLFENMGLHYIGPVDGHNIEEIIGAFEQAKLYNEPTFIHVCTVKGKGFESAEDNATLFHGVGRFNTDTGETNSNNNSFSIYFGEMLLPYMKNNNKICALTAAMCDGVGLKTVRELYPDRFFDVGIAEGHMVSFASGLAKGGMLPIVAVYSSFLQRAYDQIIHDIALQNNKIIFIIDRAGLVGEDGATHHGIFDVAMMASLPNVTVLTPATYDQLNETLEKAINSLDGIICIRLPRGSEVKVTLPPVMQRENYEVYGNISTEYAIVSYGRLLENTLNSITKIENSQNVCVVNLKQMLPIDIAALEFLNNKKGILVVEDIVKSGSAGQRIAEVYPAITETICIKNFVTFGKINKLHKMLEMDSDSIVSVMNELMRR